MPKLTTRYVRALEPQAREFKQADSELRRFLIRIRASGTKTWGVQYRLGGRFRWLTLGTWPAMTADAARKAALAALAEVERGGDPALKREAERAALSVRDLGEKWLEQHVRPKCKATTTTETARLLVKVVTPALGRRRVGDVTRADVSKLHAALHGTPVTANRTLALLHALFAFGERIGARAEGTNPARGVKRYREEARRRYLGEAELSRLGAALAEAERMSTEAPEVVGAIRLLLLTGCRKSEILGARWRDVDEERGILRLEDAKAGARDVHLNPPARAVLDALPRASEWIIPGRVHGARLVNLSKPWQRIRTAAGLEDVRLHDLRHTHASVGVSGGTSLHVLGGLLGHRQPRTTARYGHIQDDPLRRASDAIGARLTAALEGKPDADVIALPRAKGKA